MRSHRETSTARRRRGFEPADRVDGLATAPELEIQPRTAAPSGVTHGCNNVASLDRGPNCLEKLLIVAVKTQVAATVVEDQQQTPPLQPVGIDHPPFVYSAHIRGEVTVNGRRVASTI